jgi:tight adherence protein C
MNPIVWLIGGLIGSALILLYYILSTLARAVPEEDRGYMDPLPPLIKLIWPLVLLLEHHVTSHLESAKLTKVTTRLNLSGASHRMTAEQFYALKITSVIITLALVLGVQAMASGFSATYAGLGALLGFYYPDIWLSDTRKRRCKLIQKAMPMFLDFITMAVEAGLNLTGALNQVVQKGPAGPLKQEFFMVVRDLRSGLPRSDALRRMEERLQMTEISSFVGTVVQAEKMGASLGKALRSQAEQRRTERFQRAEKQAMEAPVKLIAPLMMFIFPVTFIVIGFPIAMKFLSSGAF